MHPYTRSLISAIPIPDPKLEKNKVLFTYDPSIHDYSEEQPTLVDIGHNHFVFGNTKEIEEYKAIREKNEPLKSIQIISEDAVESEDDAKSVDVPVSHEPILDTPLHDTGSKWYTFGSFLFAPVGLIGGFLFKKFNHIRNYKACLRGAIAGLITLGSVVGLFLLALLLALL